MLRVFVERKVRREIVRRNLVISAAAFVGIFALWYVEALSGLAHPFRMFVNNIHGGLSAFGMQVTGGAVDSFSLSEAGAYSILFHNGADAITMSAGYLGSAALGALMFYLVNRAPHLIRLIAAVFGVFTIGFTALFIQPSASSDWISWILCLGFGALLVILGWTGRGDINQLQSRKSLTQIVLTVASLMVGLHIVLDLPQVLSTPASVEVDGVNWIINPVAYFAENVTTGVSVPVIAFSWAAIAIALMAAAFHFSITRRLRQIPKNDDIV
ncbi:MAG: M50 family metallopeptidase [Chloroflexota bacterium]|nr:M50 family metallopeptidase [Chloroflexota bacterium]